MIPKIIHYCWFGRGKKTKLANKCINSWKKYCPDYDIIEWNEDNFDVSQYPLAMHFLTKKKYAFLTDYVRLIIIEKYGGFYFDVDVELLCNLDKLLSFGAVYSFENNEKINTGQGFGAEANHKTLIEMLKIYSDLEKKQQYDSVLPCPFYNTEGLKPFGIKFNGEKQIIDDILILPSEYFNPLDDSTGVIRKTKNTISIHWYAKSWISKKQKIVSKITRPFHRVFGNDCFRWLKKQK